MSIKSCIKSRFPNGVIMEADYSQLEVIALAYITQDDNLYRDILDGKDLHCISASFLTGKTYEYIKNKVDAGDPQWTAIRKKAKGPSFQLQYGAGYKSISENCGLSYSEAKNFIANYYSRYPKVKQWQEDTIVEAKRVRRNMGTRTQNGFPQHYAKLVSITGRRYVFKEEDAPAWLNTNQPSFSPTQIKNYPIQGLATGDIVPMMVGILGERFMEFSTVLLINTVHDSMIFDVCTATNDPYLTAAVIKTEMEKAPEYFNARFKPDIPFDLPLVANVTWGPSWGEQTERLAA